MAAPLHGGLSSDNSARKQETRCRNNACLQGPNPNRIRGSLTGFPLYLRRRQPSASPPKPKTISAIRNIIRAWLSAGLVANRKTEKPIMRMQSDRRSGRWPFYSGGDGNSVFKVGHQHSGIRGPTPERERNCARQRRVGETLAPRKKRNAASLVAAIGRKQNQPTSPPPARGPDFECGYRVSWRFPVVGTPPAGLGNTFPAWRMYRWSPVLRGNPCYLKR